MEMGIPDFFRGRSVFVTGGSGFMGKVLIEKLLRSCPELDAIYVLIRPKRGQQVAGRFSEMLDSKIFDWLKDNQKHHLMKIVPLAGDIQKPHLGLSAEDQELLMSHVSVVFHAAATVKFDETIKMSVALNLSGTKSLLELCEKMEKLESVVHVSTAFCNYISNEDIHEQLYPAPADPERVMQMVEILDDDILNSITPMLLKNRPNTYTFTKALVEHLVYDKSGRLPIAIFRPSIVAVALKEPFPGWVDNLNGPTGIFAGTSKGVLRSIVCQRDAIADIIPVDTAINCMIAIAWSTAVNRPNKIVIYNCTTGTSNPIKWKEINEIAIAAILKYPCEHIMLWYPGLSLNSSQFINDVYTFILQTVPAYLHDGLARLTGKKPFMVRLQEKIRKTLVTMQFVTTKEFRFRNDNVLRLYSSLSQQDREMFSFDINGINWGDYIETYVLGTRKYIHKEDPSTIPLSRNNLRKIYIFRKGTQLILSTLLVWGILVRSKTARLKFYQMLAVILKTMAALSRGSIAEKR